MKESAKAMVGFGFWKHLEKFMIEIEREAIEKADASPIDAPSVTCAFLESRAIRSTIRKIREEVEQYTI